MVCGEDSSRETSRESKTRLLDSHWFSGINCCQNEGKQSYKSITCFSQNVTHGDGIE